MPRLKKDSKTINVKLQRPIYERLESYCEQSGQTKTVAVERALEAYIDTYEAQQRKLQDK